MWPNNAWFFRMFLSVTVCSHMSNCYLQMGAWEDRQYLLIFKKAQDNMESCVQCDSVSPLLSRSLIALCDSSPGADEMQSDLLFINFMTINNILVSQTYHSFSNFDRKCQGKKYEKQCFQFSSPNGHFFNQNICTKIVLGIIGKV